MFERDAVVGTMSSQVAMILGSKIVGGELKPGDTLPIEGDLCTQFSVSRTTVREAIKHLAGKRLIEVQPKTGTRVLPFTDWNLLDREVLAWRLQAQFDSKIIEDIFELRLCFEPRACYLAARHGTEEEHRLIQKRYQRLADIILSASDDRLAAQAALEFHMAIINLSKNGMFITIGSAIKTVLRVSSEMLQRHAAQPSEELALYDAIKEKIILREPQAASDAMRNLLEVAMARLLPITQKIG